MPERIQIVVPRHLLRDKPKLGHDGQQKPKHTEEAKQIKAGSISTNHHILYYQLSCSAPLRARSC